MIDEEKVNAPDLLWMIELQRDGLGARISGTPSDLIALRVSTQCVFYRKGGIFRSKLHTGYRFEVEPLVGVRSTFCAGLLSNNLFPHLLPPTMKIRLFVLMQQS